eukprot:Gb_11404 [translate_table: standard]
MALHVPIARVRPEGLYALPIWQDGSLAGGLQDFKTCSSQPFRGFFILPAVQPFRPQAQVYWDKRSMLLFQVCVRQPHMLNQDKRGPLVAKFDFYKFYRALNLRGTLNPKLLNLFQPHPQRLPRKLGNFFMSCKLRVTSS